MSAGGRWGNAFRSTAPAPQSKPVVQAARLVAHAAPLVALEPGIRILAAGPARYDSTPIAAVVVTGAYVARIRRRGEQAALNNGLQSRLSHSRGKHWANPAPPAPGHRLGPALLAVRRASGSRPRRSVRPSRLLLSSRQRGPNDRNGERLSEYRCCLAGLRHFWHGSRIRWG